ncbi:MAG: MOSC domain-containing protein [Candidatus Latescibacterota bacterium]
MASQAHVHQINVSDGGVPKLPVPRAQVGTEGLVGDRQRNTQVHGGPQRAVCLYSLERLQALQQEGHPVAPGTIGENLTIAGLEWEKATPGVRLRIGEAVEVEVVSYTSPCKNICDSFRDGDFGRISQKLHPGWSRVYARVLSTGAIATGDAVVLLPAPR